MLHSLTTSLEKFLRHETPLASGIDISFQTPDRDWGARLTRPTVNLFLHEVRRSPNRSVTGTTTRHANGAYRREMLAPFVRARFACSVWTAEATDEHSVLGDVLSLVATAGAIPDEYLVDPLDTLGNPVELALAGDDFRPAVELWSALGVAPRATVELVVVLPVMPAARRDVPAPPSEVAIGVDDRDVPSRTSNVMRSAPEAPVIREGRQRRGAAVEEV